jgi:hypothetical protein
VPILGNTTRSTQLLASFANWNMVRKEWGRKAREQVGTIRLRLGSWLDPFGPSQCIAVNGVWRQQLNAFSTADPPLTTFLIRESGAVNQLQPSHGFRYALSQIFRFGYTAQSRSTEENSQPTQKVRLAILYNQEVIVSHLRPLMDHSLTFYLFERGLDTSWCSQGRLKLPRPTFGNMTTPNWVGPYQTMISGTGPRKK